MIHLTAAQFKQTEPINVRITAAAFHGKSGVFIAVELAALETLHVVAMEVLGDSFIVRRIQPQLLQMGLMAAAEQVIFLYTCVVQQFAAAP